MWEAVDEEVVDMVEAEGAEEAEEWGEGRRSLARLSAGWGAVVVMVVVVVAGVEGTGFEGTTETGLGLGSGLGLGLGLGGGWWARE